jgi:hypothetical protein
VQLSYFDGTSPVFLVITNTVPLPTAGTTAVLLLSSLQLVEPGPQIDCSRFWIGPAHLFAGEDVDDKVCLTRL